MKYLKSGGRVYKAQATTTKRTAITVEQKLRWHSTIDSGIEEAHNAKHPLLKWIMMDGGITPKAQPLEVLINKVSNIFFRDLSKEWSLNAPTNPKTGHPLAPSRQLLAQWIVKAWAKVPKEPVRKS